MAQLSSCVTVAPTSGPSISQVAAGSKSTDHPLAPLKLRRDESYFDDAKSLSDYVLIRKDRAANSGDVNPVLVPKENKVSSVTVPSLKDPPITSMRAIMRTLKMSMPKGGVGKRMPVVRTKIWNGGSAAGSANTQFNSVISLTPSTCGEFTQFANLFDECRVLGAKLHFSTLVAVSSGSQPITMHGNVVYDPIDNTAYTSLLTSLAAQQKTGLLAVGTNQFGAFAAASSWATAPAAVSKKGLYSFGFKAPKGPHAAVNGTPSGASTFYTEGLWYAVSNLTSGTDIYGYVKPYFEALSSSTFQWEWWIEYDMEFRSRT